MAKGLNGYPVNGVYKGFSHPSINVVTEVNPKDLQYFMWGLIPSWAKDDYIKKYVLEYFLEKISELTPYTSQK